MTKSTDNTPSHRIPMWQILVLLAAGTAILTVLIVVKIPKLTLRSFMWGTGSACIFSAGLLLLFPEMRDWRPRHPLPFNSRIRTSLFALYMVAAMVIMAWRPFARVLGLWSL